VNENDFKCCVKIFHRKIRLEILSGERNVSNRLQVRLKDGDVRRVVCGICCIVKFKSK